MGKRQKRCSNEIGLLKVAKNEKKLHFTSCVFKPVILQHVEGLFSACFCPEDSGNLPDQMFSSVRIGQFSCIVCRKKVYVPIINHFSTDYGIILDH